jgi:hypothetical protein
MRTCLSLLRTLPIAGFLALVSPSANAGDLYGEQYHADSFGNLVVYSPAGYKRIIVGKGHVLAEYEAQRRAEAPAVIYAERDGRDARPCRRAPGLVKGRSYMYGLPEHVVPTPGRLVCR